MKKFLTLIFIFLTSICFASGHFELAKRHMEEGKFQEAIAELDGCLAEGYTSAKVHYNLGIAHHRMGHLGEAIFHLRQAKTLNPRDSDVDFNLSYTRKGSKDSVESNKSPWAFLERLPLNKKESLYFLVFTAVFWTLMGILSLFSKSSLANYLSRASFVLTLLAGASFAYRQISEQPFGVIVAPTANVYSGKGIGNVLLFTLHAGTEFQLKEEDDGWLRINISKDKSGWLAKEAVIATKLN